MLQIAAYLALKMVLILALLVNVLIAGPRRAVNGMLSHQPNRRQFIQMAVYGSQPYPGTNTVKVRRNLLYGNVGAFLRLKVAENGFALPGMIARSLFHSVTRLLQIENHFHFKVYYLKCQPETYYHRIEAKIVVYFNIFYQDCCNNTGIAFSIPADTVP